MHNLKCSSLLKGTMILVAGLLLTACATNSKSKATSNGKEKNTVPASACIGNAYLQKYGCSTRRINQAAKSGDPDAQYALGYMYYYGIGTVRDKQTAKLWIDRAAKQGQPLAKKAEELIANGQHFHSLHRQDASGGAHYSGTRSDSARSAGRSAGNATKHAPTPSMDVLNSATPSKSLKEVLPNYKGKSSDEPKSEAVIKSLQKNSKDNAPSSDDLGKVEPITQRNPRLTPNSSPIAATAHARNAMTAVEKHMMGVSKEHFTLQLMGGRNLAAIKAFIARHHLEGKAWFYSAHMNHEKWYMVVYGDYPSVASARTAAFDLPPALRKLRPWVKSYRIVQDEIRLRRIVT